MMAAPPAGILHPAAAVRPPVLSFSHPAKAARPPAISFRPPTGDAHRRAVVLARPASPVLRCTSSSQSACGVDDDDEVYVVLPPWAPSKKEMDEILATSELSPAVIRERFRRESVEARATVLGAVADVFRPLWDNFNDVRNLKYVHETEEFQIGMPFGALMASIGMYQLWNFAPNLCLDVALPYAFYKLSVLAADVRRRGFSPDLIIRIKFALALAMLLKDIHLKCTPLDYYIRIPVYVIYFISVSWDLIGMKKFAKYALPFSIYKIVPFYYENPKYVKKSHKSSGDRAKGDGELVQSVHEPKSSSDATEGGQTLQLISEPNDSSSVKKDGEALQSVSEPDNHMHITVKQEGEPLQIFVSETDNSSDAKEGGKTLQFISEPNDSSIAKQDGEALQSVSEPNNHMHITVKQEGEPLQIFVSETDNTDDAKEGGKTLQFISEPNDSSIAEQDGQVLQSGSAPDNHIHITVKQEGEPLQVFVSEPENLY